MINLIRVIILCACFYPAAEAHWIEVPSYVRNKKIVDNSCYSTVQIEDYNAQLSFKGTAYYKSGGVHRKDTLHTGKDANTYFQNLLTKNLRINKNSSTNSLFVHLTEYVVYRDYENGYFQCALECYTKDSNNLYQFLGLVDTSLIIPERDMTGLEIATFGNEALLEMVVAVLRNCPQDDGRPRLSYNQLKASRDSFENTVRHFDLNNYPKGLYASWDDLLAKKPFEAEIESVYLQSYPYDAFEFYKTQPKRKRISQKGVRIFHNGKNVYYKNLYGYHEIEQDTAGIFIQLRSLEKVVNYYRKNSRQKSTVPVILGGAIGGAIGATAVAIATSDKKVSTPLRAKLNPVTKKLLITYRR